MHIGKSGHFRMEVPNLDPFSSSGMPNEVMVLDMALFYDETTDV